MTVKSLGASLTNYGIFWFLALLLTAFQSSLWLQLFGYSSSPYAWITILAFWTIYRSVAEGLIMVYLLSVTIAPSTAMPLDLLIFSNILLFTVGHMFRRRIYWPGGTYFMLVCGAMALMLPFTHILGSWLLDDGVGANFLFFEWIMRTLLTTLLALPLHPLFAWADRVTHKVLPHEAGSGIL